MSDNNLTIGLKTSINGNRQYHQHTFNPEVQAMSHHDIIYNQLIPSYCLLSYHYGWGEPDFEQALF